MTNMANVIQSDQYGNWVESSQYTFSHATLESIYFWLIVWELPLNTQSAQPNRINIYVYFYDLLIIMEYMAQQRSRIYILLCDVSKRLKTGVLLQRK